MDEHNRFTLPALPQVWVSRNKLSKRLNLLKALKIIYIAAPGGYGKTVAASEWMHKNKRSCVYIGLDEYHDEPMEFFRLWVEALRALQPENPVFCKWNENRFTEAPYDCTMEICKGMNGGDEGVPIVFLDDYHNIKEESIQRSFPKLLEELRKNIQIVIMSRTYPSHYFQEFLEKDEIGLIETKDLQYSLSDIAMLIKRRGIPVTNMEMDKLFSITEGWPLGLNVVMLASEVSTNKNDEIPLLNEFSTEGVYLDRNRLGKYIKSEIWNKWSPKLRLFLLKTSIVDRLNLDLCKTLTSKTDCEEVINQLFRENVFLSKIGRNEYRFHNLFREFLLDLLEREDGIDKNELYLKVANWYLQEKQYYMAVEYYLKCRAYEKVAEVMHALLQLNATGYSIEEHSKSINALRLTSMPVSIIENSPYLMGVASYGGYLNGDVSKQTFYLDQLKEKIKNTSHKKILDDTPGFFETAFMLNILDPRESVTNLFSNFIKGKKLFQRLLNHAEDGDDKTVYAPSLTQGFPFVHRSFRDFSDMAKNAVKVLGIYRRTMGWLHGKEYAVLENDVIAGLLYEQGKWEEALGFAKTAVNAMERQKTGISIETRFCAYMMLAEIEYVQNNLEESRKVIKAAREALNEENADFLMKNLHAYEIRARINSGEIDVAVEWLKSHSVGASMRPVFYKTYQYFTTARAYITVNEMNAALLLLLKLRKLAVDYNRPLDVMEADALMAIAYKKTGDAERSLSSLESAIVLAEGFGYTQIFLNERYALFPILNELSLQYAKNADRKEVGRGFLNQLLKVCGKGQKQYHLQKYGHKKVPMVKLSKNQLTIIRLLAKGYSYQGIADEMGRSVSTVKSSIREVYNKFGVDNARDAIQKAHDLDLI